MTERVGRIELLEITSALLIERWAGLLPDRDPAFQLRELGR